MQVTPWEHGDKISRLLRKVEIEGLTGEIRFNDDGRRQNYTLHVVEMTVNSAMVKVAEWTDETGFTPVAAKYVRLKPQQQIEKNRTYIVTTIVEEPYVMITDNNSFEGYCKDLADLISKRLDIQCKCSYTDSIMNFFVQLLTIILPLFILISFILFL